MITQIIHVNVVCTDIKKSLHFYTDILGARVVSPLAVSTPSRNIGKAMTFDGPATYQAYLLSFGKGSADSPGTLIDLLQWTQPPVKGKSYGTLNHVGLARICMAVDNFDKTYKELKAKGVKFMSLPQDVVLRPGSKNPMPHRICCFKDPDGVVIEITAPLK
jgi:catechol 2,3-dioxygenase-like lactoylglutathione lyase family enzyme